MTHCNHIQAHIHSNQRSSHSCCIHYNRRSPGFRSPGSSSFRSPDSSPGCYLHTRFRQQIWLPDGDFTDELNQCATDCRNWVCPRSCAVVMATGRRKPHLKWSVGVCGVIIPLLRRRCGSFVSTLLMPCTHLRGPSPPGLPLLVLRTAVAGTPLSVGRALAHTEKSQEKRVTPGNTQIYCWTGKKELVCYPAAFHRVKLLLQTFLGTGLFFIRDEDEAPPLLWFGLDGKVNVFNLQRDTRVTPRNSTADGWVLLESVKLTSPNAPKYSLMVSSLASGFNPPTKIFLTGSFFMAIALLGSIKRPSSLCSFCCSTCGSIRDNESHSQQTATKTTTEELSNVIFFLLLMSGNHIKATKSPIWQILGITEHYVHTFSTLEGSLKRTKPKPRDRPLSESNLMVQSDTSPNLVK